MGLSPAAVLLLFRCSHCLHRIPALQVRMAFDWAYCQLVAPAEPGVSLLQRIIR